MKSNAVFDWRSHAPPGVRPHVVPPAQATFAGFVRVLERLAPGPASRPSQSGPAMAGRIYQEKP